MAGDRPVGSTRAMRFLRHGPGVPDCFLQSEEQGLMIRKRRIEEKL